MMNGPFPLYGVRVLAPDTGTQHMPEPVPQVAGRVVLELGGPPDYEVLGILTRDGRLIFRLLSQCRVIA